MHTSTRRIALGASALMLTALPAGTVLTSPASAETSTEPSAAPVTVPALEDWTPAASSFNLVGTSRILVRDAALSADAATFAADLAEQTGRTLPVKVTTTGAKAGDIVLDLDDSRDDLGRQGYAFDVSSHITVTGKTLDGAFHGTRTTLQALANGTSVPGGSTVDVPDYEERAIGVCACYINISMPWLERQIKDAAYLKMNQLWLEIKVKSTAHPEANEWGYYTPKQIEHLQKVADKYHVTLVPEVNSPGHIDPWIRNRPDLQLTDKDGNKSPSTLDITQPEAYEFLTSIIDEYFQVFDTPYWHMGADEYMIGGNTYDDFPQMLAAAREKFGPEATEDDLFHDFINRINAYVKSKGKTLRIWNDGIAPDATVKLDKDIVVEHWNDDGAEAKPADLIAQGYSMMNASNALYHVRGTYGINTEARYNEDWTPLMWDGGATTETPAGIRGVKMTMWPDNASGATEREVEQDVRMPMRFVAQAGWSHDSTPDATYAQFVARAEVVGRAPGFDNEPAPSIREGRYVINAANQFLVAESEAAGSSVQMGATGTEFAVAKTADGYYTIEDPATDRCLEARKGNRQLNTPLQPLTQLTLEDCSRNNRLQRWLIKDSGEGITLTNAITQMIAVINGTGLVQQVPDGHRAQVFELTGSVEAGATIARRTVGAGESTTVDVSIVNGSDAAISDLSASVTAPAGWTLSPSSASEATLAPDGTWSTSFTATWTGSAAHDTQGFEVTLGYTDASGPVSKTNPVTWPYAPMITGDLAEGMPATQSSTAHGGTADRAVDGNTSGLWGDASLTHTEEQVNQPWWQVDLGASEHIGSVELFNRTDCCGSRLTDAVILLSDQPLPDSLDEALATPGVTSARADGTVGASRLVEITGKARYVRVQLPSSTGTLTLAEVVVRAPQ